MSRAEDQPADRDDLFRLKHCPHCEYDLSGLPGPHRCPECGFEYNADMFRLPVFVTEKRNKRIAFIIFTVPAIAIVLMTTVLDIINEETALVLLALQVVIGAVVYFVMIYGQRRRATPNAELLFDDAGVSRKTLTGWTKRKPYSGFRYLRIDRVMPTRYRLRFMPKGGWIWHFWLDCVAEVNEQQAWRLKRIVEKH